MGRSYGTCQREKAKGKRQLARHRHRWEDSIQIDRNEIGWELVDWIDLAQGKENSRDIVKVLMDPSVSQDGGEFLTRVGTSSLTRKTILHGVELVKLQSRIACLFEYSSLQGSETVGRQ